MMLYLMATMCASIACGTVIVLCIKEINDAYHWFARLWFSLVLLAAIASIALHAYLSPETLREVLK